MVGWPGAAGDEDGEGRFEGDSAGAGAGDVEELDRLGGAEGVKALSVGVDEQPQTNTATRTT